MARSAALNVYIEDPTNRTDWIFRLLLEELLGLDVDFIDKPASAHPLLTYSKRAQQDAVNIVPYGLLSEMVIRDQAIRMGKYEGIPVFFMTAAGDMPFDPFSLSFYLVSRYEEYLPFRPDGHGRFPHTESIAHKENFLHLAMVNRCALWIGQLLEKRYPDLKITLPEYRFQPTIDIDQAYAYLGKGFVRSWGSVVKLLLKGNFDEVQACLQTMRGKKQDPFDNFDMLSELFMGHNPKPIYFILAGKRGPNDRNLSVKNKRFSTLVRRLSENAGVAVHPSYGSGDDSGRIKREINGLEAITGKKIDSSRQHFVKMTFPSTYEALIRAGISHDYSMGYASISGFRAGIASAYTFYNLEKEEARPLRIHPFMFMDTTLGDYMELEPDEYYGAVSPLIDEVIKVGGTLEGIWHNYDLADDKNRHAALKKIVDKAKQG
ncbi:MAG: polysaccharide deacetylase family protein [Bacteroidales bacterium]|jgi:hypothetical protein|nr:polysaccharide deacetylase family protein [Bacteroidales bacterium]